jgi:hypothetical protein
MSFRAFLIAAALVLFHLLPLPTVAAAEETAIVIKEGSLARQQVVALGRDLVVEGEAQADVAAINGSIRVEGRVGGDVVILGGDCVLGDGARVAGDVFVLGGRIEAHQGAKVEGRSVSYPTASAAWLTLLEGPSLGRSAMSPVVIGAKLSLLAAWLGLSLLLLATSGRGVLNTAEAVRTEPFRNFFVGLTGVLALTMTALFFTAFAAAIVGLPLLALVVMLALLLKLWGMVAVFHATGSWIAETIGLGVLGAVKLVPWAGTWVWTVASLIAVGASLTTKFGRQEPWFSLDETVASRATSQL